MQAIEQHYSSRTAGKKSLDALRVKLRSQIMNESEVICCTLSSSGHDVFQLLEHGFATVIIDEACQAIELSTLIPLQYGVQRCVLVGDPNQLPPTVLSLAAQKHGYDQSLFVRLQNAAPERVHLLSIQYRMHPQISQFPSRMFYDGKLLDGDGLE